MGLVLFFRGEVKNGSHIAELFGCASVQGYHQMINEVLCTHIIMFWLTIVLGTKAGSAGFPRNLCDVVMRFPVDCIAKGPIICDGQVFPLLRQLT